MKYRKKPVVVDAEQWFKHGDNPDVSPYCETVLYSETEKCPECGKELKEHGLIGTLEGAHRVCPADWIITGVQGKRCPIKSDIFYMTYEPAE